MRADKFQSAASSAAPSASTSGAAGMGYTVSNELTSIGGIAAGRHGSFIDLKAHGRDVRPKERGYEMLQIYQSVK